jgi:hypothetical protein
MPILDFKLNRFFLNSASPLVLRICNECCGSVGDCVRRRGESIGIPLDPPLFWLDNIFKGVV